MMQIDCFFYNGLQTKTQSYFFINEQRLLNELVFVCVIYIICKKEKWRRLIYFFIPECVLSPPSLQHEIYFYRLLLPVIVRLVFAISFR